MKINGMFRSDRGILWVVSLLSITAVIQVHGIGTAETQTIILRQQEVSNASAAFYTASRKISLDEMEKVEGCWKSKGGREAQIECVRGLKLRSEYEYLAESFCMDGDSICSLEKFKQKCEEMERKWLWESTGKAAFAALEENGHLKPEFVDYTTTPRPIEVVLGKGACAGDGIYLVEALVNAGYHVLVLAINLRYKTELLKGEDDTFFINRFRYLQRLCNNNKHPLLKIHYVTSAQMETEILNHSITELQSLYAKSFKDETDSAKKLDIVSIDPNIKAEESRILKKLRNASLAEADAIIADLENRAAGEKYRNTLIIICFVGGGYEHPDEIKQRLFIRFALAEKLASWLSTRQRLGSKLAHMELPFNTTTGRGDFHLSKSGTLKMTPCITIKPNIVILGVYPREALMAINVHKNRKMKPLFYQLKDAQAIYLTVFTHPLYPAVKMSTCMKEATVKRSDTQQKQYEKFFEALSKKEDEAISEFPIIRPKYLKLKLPGQVIESEDYISAFSLSKDTTDSTFTAYLALLKGTYKRNP